MNFVTAPVVTDDMSLPWLDWTPAYAGEGSLTFTQTALSFARYRNVGKVTEFELGVVGTTGGTTNIYVYISLPTTPRNDQANLGSVWILDTNPVGGFAFWSESNLKMGVGNYNAANWNLSTDRRIYVTGRYEIT